MHGDLERQVQGRVDAFVAERGQARLQQADGRRGEGLQPSDVVGKRGGNFAAGDDGADEGGGPHAVHAQQPGALEARRKAQPLPKHAQPHFLFTFFFSFKLFLFSFYFYLR